MSSKDKPEWDGSATEPFSKDHDPATESEKQSVGGAFEETDSPKEDEGDEVIRFGPPFEPGDLGSLGPYRIVKQLGKGGMGAVFLALDPRLNRKLAMKVMQPKYAKNQESKSRFINEAQAAALISHDHIVTIYEANEYDGIPYIAMQYLKGYPLDQYLRTKGTPGLTQSLRIIRETASGLAAAHANGLIHRDVKPANLWLEAPEGRVKILDFGLAKNIGKDAKLTHSGAMLGTPGYVSPEQARGLPVNHATDIFSLGVVFYRLCTGKMPFNGSNVMAILMALATEEPPPVQELAPELPSDVAALIHKMLAKEPKDRPSSAAEVVWEIRSIQDKLKGNAGPKSETGMKVQTQYVYVPVSTSSGNNPFAELASDSYTDNPLNQDEEVAAGKSPWRTTAIVTASCLGTLLAVVLAANWIISIANREPEVQEEKFKVVQKDEEKILSPAEREAEKSKLRQAVEYAMSVGGRVTINDDEYPVQVLALLPNEFVIREVSFFGNQLITEEGLKVFEGITTIESLNFSNSFITDKGLAIFRDCSKLRELRLNSTKISDNGLSAFRNCKGLEVLTLEGVGITDAGLAHFAGCKKLRQLEVHTTGSIINGLKYFSGCNELRHLSLQAMPSISESQLLGFKNCSKLTILRLKDIDVTGDTLEQFTSMPELKELSIASAELTDNGLAPFRESKQLVVLILKCPKVTDAGLSHFQGVDQIRHLSLLEVDSTGLCLEYFSRSTSMTDLELNYSPAFDQHMANLRNFSKLNTLSLSETQVTDESLQYLKPMSNLTQLRLKNTNISGVKFSELANLKRLTFLELDGSPVVDEALPHILNFENLDGFRLANTNITDKALEEFPKLKTDNISIYLSNTAVSDEGMASISGMHNVRELILDNTSVTGNGVKLLAKMPGLNFLSLRNLNLTGQVIGTFVEMKHLRRLELAKNPISNDDLKILSQCQHLEYLDLHNTKITVSGYKRLVEAMPNCLIAIGDIEPD